MVCGSQVRLGGGRKRYSQKLLLLLRSRRRSRSHLSEQSQCPQRTRDMRPRPPKHQLQCCIGNSFRFVGYLVLAHATEVAELEFEVAEILVMEGLAAVTAHHFFLSRLASQAHKCVSKMSHSCFGSGSCATSTVQSWLTPSSATNGSQQMGQSMRAQGSTSAHTIKS